MNTASWPLIHQPILSKLKLTIAAAIGGASRSAASEASGLGLAPLLKAGTAAAVQQVLDGVYAHTPPGVVKFNVSARGYCTPGGTTA